MRLGKARNPISQKIQSLCHYQRLIIGEGEFVSLNAASSSEGDETRPLDFDLGSPTT
jgi:hypothetical protein